MNKHAEALQLRLKELFESKVEEFSQYSEDNPKNSHGNNSTSRSLSRSGPGDEKLAPFKLQILLSKKEEAQASSFLHAGITMDKRQPME